MKKKANNKLIKLIILISILTLTATGMFTATGLMPAGAKPVSAADNPAKDVQAQAGPQQASSQKEEIIYALLDMDGKVKNIYVVNAFEGGAITDYGDYTEIRNLTNSEKISQDGQKITINAGPGKFYYQGTLTGRKLPWDIEIKYFLDGREIAGQELAGKNGALEIRISVKENQEEAWREINEEFFKNFALQISLTLDSRLCSNIRAEGASLATVGGNKQATFTVLPSRGGNFSLAADVRDFEMEPITISAIRLSLDIDIDAEEFTKNLEELAKAIEKLDSGANDLLKGVNQLSEGMEKYLAGLKAYKDGMEQFASGIGQLAEGAASLEEGLKNLAAQNINLYNGALNLQQAAFDAVNSQLAAMWPGLPRLTPENYGQVLSGIPMLSAVKEQLDGVVQFTQGLKNYLDGVEAIGEGASGLTSGIRELETSSGQLAASARELYNGASALNEGVKNLRSGLSSYKAGTKELRDGTAGMDSSIEDKINEILALFSGENGPTHSFVSDKNSNVTAVQFVMKTDAISRPDQKEEANPEAEKISFWQRLLQLFSGKSK